MKEYGREKCHPFPMFFLSVVEDKPLCKHRLQEELFEYTLCLKHEYTWVIKGDYVVLHLECPTLIRVYCNVLQA